MIDQSHNLKGKIEATVQTVVTAQELLLKAALVDRVRLADYQGSCDLVAAEELFRRRILDRCPPLATAWREARGLPADPWPPFAPAATSNASPANEAAAIRPLTITPERRYARLSTVSLLELRAGRHLIAKTKIKRLY